MLKNLNKIIQDILFVSKITNTNRKKLTIFISVALSQLIAFSDIAIILFFTNLLSSETVVSEKIGFINILFEINFLLPLLIVFRYFFQYQQTVILKKLEHDVQYNLKNYMLSQLFENRNYSTADTYFYVNSLTVHISYFYASISGFLNYALQSAAFTTYLFITEPRTISAFLIGIVFLIYPIFYLIKKSREYEHLIFEKGRESNSEIQRILENGFLIKLLKKEDDEGKRYSSLLNKLYKDVLNKHKIQLLNSFLPPFATIFLISIISIFFNNFFNITLPFLGVTLRMFQSLSSLSNSSNQIINSHVHLKTFYNLEKYKNISFRENYKILNNSSSDTVFEVKNVNFRYFKEDIEIFNNINLSIKKGTHTVLTGANGSGKSTLLGLLAGVYYPNSGEIIAHTSKLGFVGPNPLIFHGTLRENLLYGNNEFVNDKKLLDTINRFKLFNINEEIDLDRIVSNKDLSSGQMQKIAFMRVFLSEVEVLFLDESTSNLDEDTKNLIFELLDEIDLTIINSTHDIERFKNVTNHIKISIGKSTRYLEKIL